MIADIILIIALLYFAIGIGLFHMTLKRLGGKEWYVKYLQEQGSNYPNVSFWCCVILVMLFWPVYLTNNNEEEEK